MAIIIFLGIIIYPLPASIAGKSISENSNKNSNKQSSSPTTSRTVPSISTPFNKDITDIGYPNFNIFTDRDGLPQNTVKTIAFDRKGYLWVGTQDGAAYFNGRRWQNISMPSRQLSNWIVSMAVTSDDSIYFGTNGGGLCHLKDGVWRYFDNTNSKIPSNFVNDILVLEQPDGSQILWLATVEGLARFENGQFTVFNQQNSILPDNYINSVKQMIDSNGHTILWVGTGSGLVRIIDGQMQKVTINNSLAKSEFYAMYVSNNIHGHSVLWASCDAGVARYENNSWQIFDKSSGLPSSRIMAIVETLDNDGAPVLWLGSTEGLISYRNNQWHLYNTENSNLLDNSIISLQEVPAQFGPRSLLIGSLAGGLARWKYDQWITFNKKVGLPDNHVYSLLETTAQDGSSIYWFGTYGGLARWNKGTWKIFDEQAGLKSNRANCLLATKDEHGKEILLVGTFGGLLKLVDDQLIPIEIKVNEIKASEQSSDQAINSVRALLETKDEHGNRILWVGTHGGLARLQNGQWTIYDSRSGLPDNEVSAILETNVDGKKILWVGTRGAGLAYLQDGKWNTLDVKHGLPNNLIRGLWMTEIDNKKVLWIGTSGGVAWTKLNNQPINNGPLEWNILSETTTPALPNNVIYEIRKDHQDNIYLFCNKGVVKLIADTNSEERDFNYIFYNFTVEDGLPSNECNTGAANIDSQGRIWAGTVAGAAVFDPKYIDQANKNLPLRIERVLVNGKLANELFDQKVGNQPSKSPVNISLEGPVESLKNLPLSYHQNSLVFEFALFNYFKETQIKYRSQLLNIEANPSPWTSYNKREFPALAAGHYVFKVWGKDYLGNISQPVIVEFDIPAAPWNTWWAYLIYLSLLMVTIYYGTKIYINSLQQKNEQLELKIKERTNTIAQQKEDLSRKNEELIYSEKMALAASRAKSTFLANMNHELRTPLNAILGFVQLMEREPHRSRPDKEKLSVIMNSGEHLLGLINDVLSISKIEAGQITLNKQHFNLSRLLENLAEMFKLRAQTKNLQFEVNYDSSLPKFVNGDEGRLRQVLINLLGNAFKFTDKGKVSLSVSFKDERAYFVVQDSGLGIEQNELSRLFIPFAQTQSGLKAKEGTGLGLVISKNLINLMDGDITVKSKYGEGSTFSFDISLPIVLLPEEIIQERKVISIVPGQEDYRLLIADDVEENRVFLAELLSSVGFRVRQVSNGVEAVQIWEEWHPHLIWMDMRMPVMDGNDATRLIRKKEQANGDTKFNRTVIIALTASSFAHDRSTIIANGCDDFVPKPFKINTIFEKLAQKLGIDFVFEHDAHMIAAQSLTEIERLTSSNLSSLPPELLNELSYSIINGDVELAAKVTEQIKLHNNQIAQSLEIMIKNYKFDEILELMGKTL